MPIRLEDMKDPKVLNMCLDIPGGIYMLSDEPGYSLPFKVWAYFLIREEKQSDEIGLEDIISKGEEKIVWLARQIFEAFPGYVTGLKISILDCGCIYYQRKSAYGKLISKPGIYRDAEDGPCEACMLMGQNWKSRVIDEKVVYNSKIEIQID